MTPKSPQMGAPTPAPQGQGQGQPSQQSGQKQIQQGETKPAGTSFTDWASI